MVSYALTKKDYEFLYSIVEVDDTIAFAADNVFELMANPSITLAKEMYESGIQQWFDERRMMHRPDNGKAISIEDIPDKYQERIVVIKDRYLIQ